MRSAYTAISVLAEEDKAILDYEDLLEGVQLDGKILKNGELHGETNIGREELEMNIAKEGVQNAKGQYTLRDGTTVKFYQSSSGGEESMQINTGGLIYKIRVR